MAVTIKRTKDNRQAKTIAHRVADVPNGVGVVTANLGGNVLEEGTLLGKAEGTDGLFAVVKTARVLKNVGAQETTLELAKGHHFVVGDNLGTDKQAGKAITAIDSSDRTKDVVTLAGALGALKAGAGVFETDGAKTAPKVTPIAVAGDSVPFTKGESADVSAWVQAVVYEATAPAVTEALKASLKGVIYI